MKYYAIEFLRKDGKPYVNPRYEIATYENRSCVVPFPVIALFDKFPGARLAAKFNAKRPSFCRLVEFGPKGEVK